MTDVHRDADGNLDEPVFAWDSHKLTAAQNDPFLTKLERMKIKRYHGPLNGLYA